MNSWIKYYPSGIPEKIQELSHASLGELFDEQCQQYAEKPAFSYLGHEISYQQFAQQVRNFAAFLQQDLQLKKGDRIALMMPNILQYPIAIAASLKIGLIIVNVNPSYTATELIHQLSDAQPTTIIVLDQFLDTIESIILQLKSVQFIITTHLGDCLPFYQRVLFNLIASNRKKYSFHLLHFLDALNFGKNMSLDPVAMTLDDTALLQYTGGTTGVIKGAILSHKNLLANIEQIASWFQSSLEKGKEILITALPLYHIFAFTGNFLLMIKLGGLNVLIPNPKDMKAVLTTLQKTRFTIMTGVNTLFNTLLLQPELSKLDFSHLKFALAGGMSLHHETAARWQKVTHKPILQGYGLTECAPAVCIDPIEKAYHNDSIGLPLPSTEIKICDDNDQAVAINSIGELCIKGPQVMTGYWHQPIENQLIFNAEGWLKSGDLAYQDEEGFIYIVDRKKDVINVSGFNVYPNEVEDLINRYPDILESAVIGCSDQKSGETVKAFIVLKPNARFHQEDFFNYLTQHLAHYKLPKHLEITASLPKSAVGKILKRELKS